MSEEQNLTARYFGKNVLNVKSDLERLYPQNDIVMLTPNSIITMDYRTDRIRITYDNNNNVLEVRIG